MRCAFALALVFALTALAACGKKDDVPAAPPEGAACDDVPSFHALDFWVGEWTVRENGKIVGENRIEKILSGCAVVEHWRDAEGHEGQSLFFHPPRSASFSQIWVTDHATSRFGSKQKVEVPGPAGSLRFQGTQPMMDGSTILDRTTLTPLPDGHVRQQIEISKDAGATWENGFDAVYERTVKNEPPRPSQLGSRLIF